MTSDHAVDIDRHVRIYITVFVALMVLTIVTVAVSRFHLPVPIAVTVALIVATIKGSLVACYFMHLISEKKLIYAVLALTVASSSSCCWPFPSSPPRRLLDSLMNLRWVHALLILLSAALAVLFGALVFGPVRTRGRARQPARGHRGVRGVVRPGRLRLLVPAQDEDAAMKLERTHLGIRASRPRAVVLGGSTSVLACPVCFGAEETSMIDGTKLGMLALLASPLQCRARSWASSSISATREAHRGPRPRHRMVGAPGRNVENMTEWLGLPPLASAHGGQIDNLIGWIHIFMFILFVGWGGVLPLRHRAVPAIAEPGGGLQGGHVAQIDVSRGRRGRRRSRSPDRIRDPAVGREGR